MRVCHGSAIAFGPSAVKSSSMFVSDLYAGHFSRPGPFGFPVFAKFAQYALAAFAAAWSAAVSAAPYFAPLP